MADAAVPVRVEDVTIGLGARVVIDGLSLTCSAGEWVVLVGPSGCGKTTLLRTINGLHAPTRGVIWTLDTPIPGRSKRQAREVWRRTGTVMQDIALFETRNVRRNVELGLRAAGVPRPPARVQASVWLERLGLEGWEHERPFRLSGGQRQRVALARAMATRPRLLILDEPTSAIDRATARVVLDAVAELARAGSAVMMSSHRLDEVERLCDRVLDLDGGPPTPSAPAPPRDRTTELQSAPPPP